MRTERMTGFDSLRFFLVVCVVALHASMTYMAYVPTYWYVKDAGQSFTFTQLVLFLDSFPMSALFFIAGYFAAPSLNKRGAKRYLKSKTLRLCIPWLLGVILAAPFFAYASYKEYGLPAITFFDFLTKQFTGPFYQQGHYWFLGTLFFFMLVYFLAAKKTRLNVQDEEKCSRSARWTLLALFLLSALSYCVAVLFVKPAGDWLNIGYVIYFQPARIINYAGFFLCGCLGWKRGWFKKGCWTPNTLIWGIAALMSTIFLLDAKIRPWQETERLLAVTLEALSYTGVTLSMTILLVSLFLGTADKIHPLTAPFEGNSYGIYWFHQIILMPLLFAIKPLRIPIGIKWALAIPLTVFICFFLSKLLTLGKKDTRHV